MRGLTVVFLAALFAATGAMTACGGPPALGGAPRPDPAIVAGVAAATAAAVTLADPHAADRRPEKKEADENQHEVVVHESVSESALDRLDESEVHDSDANMIPAQPAPPGAPIKPTKKPAKKATPATTEPPNTDGNGVSIPTPEDAARRYSDPTKR